MGVTTKTLYDTDFVEWTARTAELARSGRLSELDLEHRRKSIVTSQPIIRRKFQDSPSLRRFLLEELQNVYGEAVRGAVFETGVKAPVLPKRCPFTLDELIGNFDLAWPR